MEIILSALEKWDRFFKCWVLIRLNWAKWTILIYCNCILKRHSSSSSSSRQHFLLPTLFLWFDFTAQKTPINIHVGSYCITTTVPQFMRWCSVSEEAWWCCVCCGWCWDRPRWRSFSLWPSRRWCSSCWSCGSWRSLESAVFPRDSLPLPEEAGEVVSGARRVSGRR